MKKKWIFLLLMILIFIYACGCSEEKRSKNGTVDSAPQCEQEEAEQDLTTICVAVQEYYISSSIGYILDNHLDEKFGLKLVPVMYPSGAEQILDIDQNIYDVATIGASFLYPLIEDQAILIGEHIKCTGGNAIYARKGSPVLEVKGFNPIYPEVYGDPETVKKCTILMKENTTSQYLGMKWLESIGVKADSVSIEYMDFDQMYEEFSEDYGDATVLTAPFSYQAEKSGYIEVATTESLFINMYEVIIATNEAYETKRDALVQFLGLLLYANEELEADFNRKMSVCGSWYEKNDVNFTRDILKQECKDKLFITRDNYEIEEFGKFEYKYAEYMAAIGNIPPIKLKNVKENMDVELFREALETAP